MLGLQMSVEHLLTLYYQDPCSTKDSDSYSTLDSTTILTLFYHMVLKCCGFFNKQLIVLNCTHSLPAQWTSFTFNSESVFGTEYNAIIIEVGYT